MIVDYQVFFDGERKPAAKGTASADTVLRKYITNEQRVALYKEVDKGVKVDHTDRRRGVRLVMGKKGAKPPRNRDVYKVLELELQGHQTKPQMLVAAIEELKKPKGFHRTVIMVKANGFIYKVKCHHKGLTFTDAIRKATIELMKIA